MDREPGQGASSLDRRSFLKVAGVGAGLAAAGAASACAAEAEGTPWVGRIGGAARPASNAPSDVVVVGGGAFGGWSALHLAEMGARVTLVDTWGPGNSRATSGDETRGIRTAYGAKEHWTRMASEAIRRWQEWDEEWARELQLKLFFHTGDLIMRDDWEPLLTDSREVWDQLGIEYEVLDADEIRYRWPQIDADPERAAVGLYEVNAGVARARRSCEAVAEVFRRKGGRVVVARAEIGETVGDRVTSLALSSGETLTADAFVFALGPWLRTFFPNVFGNRMRTPLGYVFYYGTPAGDNRFVAPNMPSYNVPGVTGWPSLPNDARGFRVRTGGGEGTDPDTSVRWIPAEYHERPRNVLVEWFPDLAEMPLLETRACHYELSVERDFVIDLHPDYSNLWISGAGSAEGFKQGPVVGEITARRVLGAEELWPDLADHFKVPTREYDPRPPDEEDEPETMAADTASADRRGR